jgi:hypothetical protein
MKLLIELDMNPDIEMHQRAGDIKAALVTVIESAFSRIPPGARLSGLFDQYPDEKALILAEAVHDPVENRDVKVAVEYPVNLRIVVSREAFDTTCHAKAQAERSDTLDKLVLEPAHVSRRGIESHPGMTIRRS